MTSFFSLNSSLRQQPPPPNSMDPDPSSTLNGPITHSFYHPQNQSRNGQTGRGRNHRGPTHDSTLPIPAGVMAKAGGSERNGNGLGGIPPFEIARSPPGNKSRPPSWSWERRTENRLIRYKACSVQVLYARNLSSGKCLPFLSHHGSSYPECSL